MTVGALTMLVDRLRHSSGRVESAQLSDGQQLERFIADRSELALAELIRRHGRTVFGVCRRILANHADAEDAFQATFLVLVRKADQVKPRELVGPWLHGVARRTALCARRSATRRRESSGGMVDMPSPKPICADSEMLAVLDDELARLPDKYRIALVLCELEGRTIKQVAHQLTLPEGTIASRLHRARAMLTKRMRRYQASLTAGAIMALLASQGKAALPPGLVLTTAKAGAAFALGSGALVGITTQVTQLTEGVLKLMLLTKIKIASSAILVLAFMTGSGVALRAATSLIPNVSDDPPAATATAAAKPDAKQINKFQALWSDLADNDDVKVTKAILALAAAPSQSVPFFQSQLRPVVIDAKKVQQWIGELANDKEAVRDLAAKELDYLAPMILEELRKAVEKAPNEDTHRRFVKILFDGPDGGAVGGGFAGAVAAPAIPAPGGPPIPLPPQGGVVVIQGQAMIAGAAGPGDDFAPPRKSWRQAVRAVTILEHIGGADSIATLKKISEGEAKAAPTKAAKEALARIGQRMK